MEFHAETVNGRLDDFENEILSDLEHISFEDRQTFGKQTSFDVVYGPLDFTNPAQKEAFEDKLNWLVNEKSYGHLITINSENILEKFEISLRDVTDKMVDLQYICTGVNAIVGYIKKSHADEKRIHEQKLNLELNIVGLPYK